MDLGKGYWIKLVRPRKRLYMRPRAEEVKSLYAFLSSHDLLQISFSVLEHVHFYDEERQDLSNCNCLPVVVGCILEVELLPELIKL